MPLICVGNISVGGTGKSPMVEYLIKILQPHFKVATLSRGYKRKTKGYALANAKTTALEIGDEPMQFHLKFPHIAVAVGERRLEAIPQLLQDKPDTDVIILDDAFQHREIKAGYNIVLTDYNNLYTSDWYLPTGDLRDNPSSAKNADIIIVTKCPADITENRKQEILHELNPTVKQHVFFSSIAYGIPYHITKKIPFHLHADCEILLICGIANPRPLKKYIEKNVAAYFEKTFNDHHIFTIDDLNDIKNRYEKLDGAQNIILTTEKDAVRLLKFESELENFPLFVLPIEHFILFNENEKLNKLIFNYINMFKHRS